MTVVKWVWGWHVLSLVCSRCFMHCRIGVKSHILRLGIQLIKLIELGSFGQWVSCREAYIWQTTLIVGILFDLISHRRLWNSVAGHAPLPWLCAWFRQALLTLHLLGAAKARLVRKRYTIYWHRSRRLTDLLSWMRRYWSFQWPSNSSCSGHSGIVRSHQSC